MYEVVEQWGILPGCGMFWNLHPAVGKRSLTLESKWEWEGGCGVIALVCWVCHITKISNTMPIVFDIQDQKEQDNRYNQKHMIKYSKIF